MHETKEGIKGRLGEHWKREHLNGIKSFSHNFFRDINLLIMADFDVILKAWAPIEGDLNGNGGVVLNRLFERHPKTLELFPKFAGKSQQELVGSAVVAEQGGVVLKKLGELLNARGDHSAILKPLATNHAKTHKIPIGNFGLISEIVVELMAEKSGLDSAGQDAMRKVMTTVIADIDAVYKELNFQG